MQYLLLHRVEIAIARGWCVYGTISIKLVKVGIHQGIQDARLLNLCLVLPLCFLKGPNVCASNQLAIVEMDGFACTGFSTAQRFGGRTITCHLVSADVARAKAANSLDVVVCHVVGSRGLLSYGVLLTSTLPLQLEDCDLG